MTEQRAFITRQSVPSTCRRSRVCWVTVLISTLRTKRYVPEALVSRRIRSLTQTLQGRTPLHFAAGDGGLGAVSLLLANKADPNAADYAGITPLHLAVQHRRNDAVQTLLKNDANINIRDNNVRSAALM